MIQSNYKHRYMDWDPSDTQQQIHQSYMMFYSYTATTIPPTSGGFSGAVVGHFGLSLSQHAVTPMYHINYGTTPENLLLLSLKPKTKQVFISIRAHKYYDSACYQFIIVHVFYFARISTRKLCLFYQIGAQMVLF